MAADNNEINSVDDLKGKTVAVQIGTTGAAKAQGAERCGHCERHQDISNTVDVVFLELLNGTVDAVINDLPVNEKLIWLKTGQN